MASIFYQRVEALRALMRENHWDIVVLTGSDPHAGLWTDTSYCLDN